MKKVPQFHNAKYQEVRCCFVNGTCGKELKFVELKNIVPQVPQQFHIDFTFFSILIYS